VDAKIREERQREFTLYLVLFILLVIVGAVGYNNQNQIYYGGYAPGPYGYGGYPMYGAPCIYGAVPGPANGPGAAYNYGAPQALFWW